MPSGDRVGNFLELRLAQWKAVRAPSRNCTPGIVENFSFACSHCAAMTFGGTVERKVHASSSRAPSAPCTARDRWSTIPTRMRASSASGGPKLRA